MTQLNIFGDSELQSMISEIKPNALVEQRALRRIIENQELHFYRAKALSDLCVTPKQGEQYRIITEKQFNAYALILHLLQTCTIEEMFLAVYRINEPTVDSIIDFIETGKIKKACFVISNFFQATKKPEKWAIRLKKYCEKNDRCRHVYVHNHAKVVCLRTDKDDFFVFEGSGNMSDNARIEQYLYENNRSVYDFHASWMIDLVRKEPFNKV